MVELGFEDVSHNNNGLAYRLRFEDKGMEYCHYVYVNTEIIRLQTIASGHVTPLPNIRTVGQLKEHCLLHLGRRLG